METDRSILVIGDVMLDTYIYGKAKRLSPEAPCPVIDCCESPIHKLGGAANVAFQIALSGFNTSLWGVIGNDNSGLIVKNLLQENSIKSHISTSDFSSTTVKTRYLAGNHQQLLRVDNDATYISSINDADSLVQILQDNNYSVVVISDYGKGAISQDVAIKVISECNRLNITTIVDIKDKVRAKYNGVSVIKGNKSEFLSLFAELGLDSTSPIEHNLFESCKALSAKCVVMTCGNEGISAYSLSDGYVQCDADSISIHDVTGAGDMVTAFLAMLFDDESMTFSQKIEYANIAAHKKVSQVGTGLVLLDEVIHNSKITTAKHIKSLCDGKKVVFTNGCFDVLHNGHVRLLNKAKKHGDILVVGLNSDDSIKRLKGNHRPVNNFDCRAEILSSLSSVDFIIGFDEDTPIDLIKDLNPDVIVKGGDYSETEIVGAELVKNNGGNIVIIPFVENQSSTNILKRLGYE